MTLRLLGGLTLVLALGATACSNVSSRVADAPPRQPPTAVATPAGQDVGQHGEPAEEKAPANTLRWATASEVDNFGFDVYRADSEDGPFQRLTAQPIGGAGTVDVPVDYAYVDDTIQRGREYFYYVESISMDGQRTRFTPIMRAPAKD